MRMRHIILRYVTQTSSVVYSTALRALYLEDREDLDVIGDESLPFNFEEDEVASDCARFFRVRTIVDDLFFDDVDVIGDDDDDEEEVAPLAASASSADAFPRDIEDDVDVAGDGRSSSRVEDSFLEDDEEAEV